MTRTCAGCPAELVRRPNERPGHFNSRRYCSAACAAGTVRKTVATRQCERCGRDIPRQPGSRILRPHEYARRRFCANTCTGDPHPDLPSMALVAHEWNHFAGYGWTTEKLAAELHCPVWYVEQAVAS